MKTLFIPYDFSLTSKHADISPEFRLADQLLEFFKKEKPDCMVMFPTRYEWYQKLFISSKTMEVMNRLRKPLLVLYS